MRKLVRKLFDIREGEGLKASLMFAYIFLIIASLLIIKPVRTSLFLTAFGASQLPYVFILVAIFAALITKLYSMYSQRVLLNKLIFYTTLISIGCLLFFWLFLHFEYRGGWYIYAFYIWVAIFGVITTSQFWLLANYVFNAREAKRLFGFVGAGAISGGIFGGYLTKFLAPVFGTDNLIFLSIGFLVCCLFILSQVWRSGAQDNYREKIRQQKKLRRGPTGDGPVRKILTSRHVRLLACMVGIGVIVASLVHYQFSAIASKVFTNEDQLTAFFGFWLSNLSIASLVIQLFLTGRVLRHFGVVTSLFFLPIGILIGAVAIFLNPALWSAVLIKVSDGGFKQSINKAGLVLLAVPIPTEIRGRAKAFVDIFVDSLATGVGGVLLILFTQRLGFSTQHISIMVTGFIVLWMYLIISVKREYINSFRLALEKGTIDLDEQTVNIQDASVFEAFERALSGDNQRQILYVLKLIENIKNEQFVPHLKRLIHHPSADIRLQAVKLLSQFEHIEMASDMQPLIHDHVQDVRVEALRYVCKHTEDKAGQLRHYFATGGVKLRSAALLCAAHEYRDDADFRQSVSIREFVHEFVGLLDRAEHSRDERVFLKVTISKVIGTAGDIELYSLLSDLLYDDDLRVVQEAIISAGATKDPSFVPALIQHLSTHQVRKSAREALVSYGENIIATLETQLTDPNVDRRIRMSIPRVLSLISSQRAADLLIKNLDQKDLALRYEILRAVNKLRMRFPLLKFPETTIYKRITMEAEQYIKTLAILQTEQSSLTHELTPSEVGIAAGSTRGARKLLVKALEERLGGNLERIFRLLGLRYPARDMYNAYEGITSGKVDLRANAIEFLDNLLDLPMKKIVILMVEPTSRDMVLHKSGDFFKTEIGSESEGLQMLLEGDDSWLRACALYLIAELGMKEPLWLMKKFTEDMDPVVRETAEFALARLEGS